MSEKQTIQEKRKALIELSVQARMYRETKLHEATTQHEILYWASVGINRVLLAHFYNTDGSTQFKTFHEWKKEGATIIKGSKAFLIWGQPRKATKKQEAPEPNADPTEEQYKLWPLCFLFSDKQVFMPTAEEAQPEQVEELQEVAEPFILEV